MKRLLAKHWRVNRVTTFIVALLLISVAADRVPAVSRDYTLDMNQSNIAVSGTVDSQIGANKPIEQQGPGSLTTKYTGTIKTDRITDGIQFVSGSAIDANTNGTWQPGLNGAAGSVLADYGGKISGQVVIIVPVNVTVNFAGRDFVFGFASPALTVTSGQFPLSSTDLTFTTGAIDYRSSLGTPAAREDITGQSGTLSGNGMLGTLSQAGLVYETLTVPMNATLDIQADATTAIHLTLSGQLFGTYLIPSSNGDYNQNGFVDAADYALWRETLGLTGVGLAADGNGDNQITTADYNVWRSKFGQAIGSGAGLSAGAVPEPSALALVRVVTFLGCARRKRSLAH